MTLTQNFHELLCEFSRGIKPILHPTWEKLLLFSPFLQYLLRSSNDSGLFGIKNKEF